MQFKNEVAEVHLIDLAEATAGIPLCADHARTRTAPVGWTLVDLRTPTQPDVWIIEDEPSLDDAPPARRVEDQSSALNRRGPRDGAEPRMVRSGHDRAASDNPRAFSPSGPLLSRAFRGVTPD